MPEPDATFLDFPVAIDSRGRVAAIGIDDHIRDLIRKVVFTNPG